MNSHNIGRVLVKPIAKVEIYEIEGKEGTKRKKATLFLRLFADVLG
jgi:hypothetical protein